MISDETGSGLLVFATTPTLTTPVLGVATATSINKMAITAPATSSTLAVADGKTATISNTLTFTGTDGSSLAIGAGGTVVYLGGTNTWTGQQTLSFTGTGGNPIHGTNTNDAASAGYVGETLSQSRVLSAATGVTTNTTLNVTASQIVLTAGDWLIRAAVGVQFNTGTTCSAFTIAISATSATLPASDTSDAPNSSGEMRVNQEQQPASAAGSGATMALIIPSYRVSVSGSTTLYLVARATFLVSTLTTFGWYQATRIR